jgi:hypothetical protein
LVRSDDGRTRNVSTIEVSVSRLKWLLLNQSNC